WDGKGRRRRHNFLENEAPAMITTRSVSEGRTLSTREDCRQLSSAGKCHPSRALAQVALSK
ncbi:MAG: hypothetical protein ACK53L_27975, partial [Pirellulaceae bacterium]